MSDYFKYKFGSNTITLLKPTDWHLITYDKISEKFHLHKNKVLKYIIYYSQLNYGDKNSIIDFKKIDLLENNVIKDLFISYINSDKEILSKHNKRNKIRLIDEGLIIIDNYIKDVKNQFGSFFVGVAFLVNSYNLWFKSLRGELTDETKKVIEIYSELLLRTYKENPKYFENIKSVINDVKYFINNKKDIYKMIDKINLVIEKAKRYNIWIPSRYCNQIFDELLKCKNSKLEKINIEKFILKFTEGEISQKYLNEWLKVDLLKKRNKILKEAFEAHKRKLYAPAITCFLTQLEYIILKIAQMIKVDKKARNVNREMIVDISTFIEDKIIKKKKISELLPFNSRYDKAIYYFQIKSLAQYLKQFTYEDTDKIEKDTHLNRHGILHGIFVNYPNENNCIKIVLLIDELIRFYTNLKTGFQLSLE